MEFKGKVKKVVSITYRADTKFGEVQKGEKIYAIWENEFDEKGNKLKELRLETDNRLVEKRLYLYDEFNKRIDKKVFNENEKLSSHQLYKYDGDECQQFLKIRNQEFNLRYLFKLDNLGNRIEKIIYNSLGKIVEVYKYKFNRTNNCVQELYYKYDGSLRVFVKNKYGKNNNQIQTKKINSDGSIHFKNKFKFDKDSNCIKMIFYKPDNSIDESHIFKYDYNGNIIKSKTLDSQGRLKLDKKNLNINMIIKGIG